MPLDEVGPGSLKCVSVWSADRSVGGIVEEALRAHVRPEDVRRLHGDTFVIFTDADAADVRDWLAGRLEEGESAFVVEFEHWSGHGAAPDRRWLLRRGH